MENRKVGVIPYRISDGRVEVLLVTSRGGGRWIIPKGHVEPELGPRASAQLEAYEEAGVRGHMHVAPIGTYEQTMTDQGILLQVYLMRVTAELKVWPEAAERKRAWMLIRDALNVVDEDGLREALLMTAEMLH